ncbi:hypothetical protein EV424DRAFT_1425902, partial [Suillus variegatus]
MRLGLDTAPCLRMIWSPDSCQRSSIIAASSMLLLLTVLSTYALPRYRLFVNVGVEVTAFHGALLLRLNFVSCNSLIKVLCMMTFFFI